MDLEKLTKTQLILLALLVSFVTSIATGITTVTLMDQAPLFITQPITRVVQRTVEKIIPGETREVTLIETVIIKEEDLIVEAINANRNTIVVISSLVDDEDLEDQQVVGGGFIISRSGFVVTDSAFVSEEESYSITIGDDIFNIELITKNEEGFSLLKIALPDGQLELSSYANLISAKNLKEGQNVIALSGPSISVSIGIISGFLNKDIVVEESSDGEIEEGLEGELEEDGEKIQEMVTVLDRILTTLNLSSEQSGSIVINSDGQVIGFAIVRDGKTSVIPASFLTEAIAQAPLNTPGDEIVE